MVVPLLAIGIPLAIKHGPKVVKGGIKAYNKRKTRKAQEAGLQGLEGGPEGSEARRQVPDQDMGNPRGQVYDEESSDFEDDRPEVCPAPKKRKWGRG